MLKSVTSQFDPPCRLSWLLVEVDEGSSIEYHAIHSVEVLGDCNDAYITRKVRFTLDRHELTGIIRLASDDLKAIESERDRLLSIMQENLSKEVQPLKPELWCLARQTTDDSKVRLVVISCKKLTCVESQDVNKKHFLMQKGQAQVPIALLHIVDSEKQLFDEMAFLNETFIQSFMSEETDFEIEIKDLKDAFYLVQYFEDSSNLVYTIIRYADTIWKDKNLFPNVVTYITDGKTVSQCVILRKSFDKLELAELLSEIKTTCDCIDYPLLHSQLKKTALKTEDNRESFPGS